jgi:hypothetical protein
MSERATYLRDQAEKCEWQARRIMDAETKTLLLAMAAEYIERAEKIESKEKQ